MMSPTIITVFFFYSINAHVCFVFFHSVGHGCAAATPTYREFVSSAFCRFTIFHRHYTERTVRETSVRLEIQEINYVDT